MGLDLSKLDKTQFGVNKQALNIYNRFFRTAVLKSVKFYFSKYNSITIQKIYHDNSMGLETHKYFPWQPIFAINEKDDKISFACHEIEFIDSDHRKSSNVYSNFVQFIDLLLGCMRNCIDYTSTNSDTVAISEQSLPVVTRLIEKPNNINSSYKYVGRQKIEFFPKYQIKGLNADSLEAIHKKMNSFYTKRLILIRDKNQLRLPF